MQFLKLGALLFTLSSFLNLSALIPVEGFEGHVYEQGISYVLEQGIMKGDASGFAPDRALNRAELIKIVIQSKYDADVIEKCIQTYRDRSYWYVFFRDVPTESWYAPYICVAQQTGLVRGYSDGTLRPEETINFVEAAKILLGVLGLEGDPSALPWYKPFVEELGARKAIPTSIANLDSPLKRGEFAEIIWRVLQNVTTEASKTFADFTAPGEIPCDMCLVIPKLKIEVPIIFDVGLDALAQQDWSTLEKQLLNALQDGVVHYPGTARPGQRGNVFITGHSSFYATDPGKYKEVFARLPDLQVGDQYELYYQGRKYVYQIFEEKIVKPEDVHVLDQTPIEERSSLMTCWPRYTNKERKIFTARRVE